MGGAGERSSTTPNSPRRRGAAHRPRPGPRASQRRPGPSRWRRARGGARERRGESGDLRRARAPRRAHRPAQGRHSPEPLRRPTGSADADRLRRRRSQHLPAHRGRKGRRTDFRSFPRGPTAPAPRRARVPLSRPAAALPVRGVRALVAGFRPGTCAGGFLSPNWTRRDASPARTPASALTVDGPFLSASRSSRGRRRSLRDARLWVFVSFPTPSFLHLPYGEMEISVNVSVNYTE